MSRPQAQATSEAIAWLALDPQRRVYDAARRFAVRPSTLYRAMRRAGMGERIRAVGASPRPVRVPQPPA